jgi:hypothetical protein
LISLIHGIVGVDFHIRYLVLLVRFLFVWKSYMIERWHAHREGFTLISKKFFLGVLCGM